MADEVQSYEREIGKRLLIIIGLAIVYYLIYMNLLCDYKHQDFINEAGRIDLDLYSQMEGRSCSDFTHRPMTHIIVLIMMYGLSEYMIWQSRYHLHQITVNGYHGSVIFRPEIVGPWVIFQVGKNLFPVPLPGSLGTLIVPKTHIQRAGNNYIGLTYVEKTPLVDIPEDAADHIYKSEKYNKKNVYFGVYSEGFIKMNEEILDYDRLWKKQNQRINELKLLLEGKYDSFEEVVNITEKLSRRRRGLFGILPGRGKKDDDEE